MMKLFIKADYNDADYVQDLIEISEENFNRFKPLIDAINNFQPYVRHHHFGGIVYHNWDSPRQDLGELDLYETYPQFSKELIDEFNETFLSMHNPEAEYGGTFHTIVELKNVITDEVYIDGDHRKILERKSDKIKEYEKERAEIYAYKRKSDNKPFNCIPFNEMTDEENELCRRLDTLWTKYV